MEGGIRTLTFLENTMKTLTLLLIPAFLYGCSDACEKAGDQITAKYEECGITLDEGDGDGESVECTDELATQSQCTADCTTAADCGVLDGTDTDMTGEAWTSYLDCLTGCV